MAEIIGIVGRSGTGKTTSIAGLDPTTTFYFNADKKPLSFPGWKKKYNEELGNYWQGSSVEIIRQKLKEIDEQGRFKIVIIDTINACYLDKEMRDIKQKSFDKWADLVQDTYMLFDFIRSSLSDNLYVIVMAHEESVSDDDGVRVRRIQTSGRKLAKIVLESKMTTVLFTRVEGDGASNEYFFETQSAGGSTGKSPFGMFSDFLVPNDLKAVVGRVHKYNNGE